MFPLWRCAALFVGLTCSLESLSSNIKTSSGVCVPWHTYEMWKCVTNTGHVTTKQSELKVNVSNNSSKQCEDRGIMLLPSYEQEQEYDHFANNVCPTLGQIAELWLTSESGWVRVTLKGCPLSWPRMWLFRLYWLLKVFSQPLLGQLNGFSPTIRLETEREVYRNRTKVRANREKKTPKTRISVLFKPLRKQTKQQYCWHA